MSEKCNQCGKYAPVCATICPRCKQRHKDSLSTARERIAEQNEVLAERDRRIDAAGEWVEHLNRQFEPAQKFDRLSVIFWIEDMRKVLKGDTPTKDDACQEHCKKLQASIDELAAALLEQTNATTKLRAELIDADRRIDAAVELVDEYRKLRGCDMNENAEIREILKGTNKDKPLEETP